MDDSGSDVQVIHAADAPAWWHALRDQLEVNVFYHPDLLDFLARTEGGSAELLVLRSNTGATVMPWIVRPLPTELQLPESDLFDAVGPDYAGPSRSGDDAPTIAAFAAALKRHGERRGVVTAFLRLNPLSTSLAQDTEVFVDPVEKEIVWVDLTLGFETLWRSFDHSARKNYKRATASALSIRVAQDDEHVGELAQVYAATMDRRHAEARYRFDREFFAGLLAAARGRTMTVTAMSGDRVAASHLYLVSDGIAFSYLGGADPEFTNDRPTNGVVTTAIRELADSGARRLVLGGGFRRGDGIERFKRTFSSRTAGFRAARLVLDPKRYAAACDATGHPAESSGFFPAYRRPSSSTTHPRDSATRS